ncbi:hypothetical protein F4780DRAFT_786764 [Xylariomycetidae sp. FL0641]|nr:hypothetical protein F4780DRAFT_786764 [Xylariomycetidae sp. FL0641]
MSNSTPSTSVLSLPTELLQGIGQSFESLKDLVAFTSVCKRIRSTVDDGEVFKFTAARESVLSRKIIKSHAGSDSIFEQKGHALTMLINAGASLDRIKRCVDVYQISFPQAFSYYARALGRFDAPGVRLSYSRKQVFFHDTPVCAAASRGRLDVVWYLIGRGYDVNRGNRPYHFQGDSPRELPARVKTAFDLACEAGCQEIAFFLLECGFNVDERMLRTAAGAGLLEVVQALLQSPAIRDSSHFDDIVRPAVHHAVTAPQPQMHLISFLLAAVRSDDMRSSILEEILRSRQGCEMDPAHRLQLLKQLIDLSPVRPLPLPLLESVERIVAVSYDDHLLRYLVEENPGVLAETPDEQEVEFAKILSIANFRLRSAAGDYLRERQRPLFDGPPEVALRAAIRANEPDFIDVLAARGVSLSTPVLHPAYRNPLAFALYAVVSQGVSLSTPFLHPTYQTPLAFALYNGSIQVALRLLHHGADAPLLTEPLRSKILARVTYCRECNDDWAGQDFSDETASEFIAFPYLYWPPEKSEGFANKVEITDELEQNGKFMRQVIEMYRLVLGSEFDKEASRLWTRTFGDRVRHPLPTRAYESVAMLERTAESLREDDGAAW